MSSMMNSNMVRNLPLDFPTTSIIILLSNYLSTSTEEYLLNAPICLVAIIKASLSFLHKREFHQNVLIAPLITPSPASLGLIGRNVS